MNDGPLSREGLQKRQAIQRTLQTAIWIGILATAYFFIKIHATSGDIEVNPGPSTLGWAGSSEKTSNGGLGSWTFRQENMEDEVRQREERRQEEEEERAREQERRQEEEAAQREQEEEKNRRETQQIEMFEKLRLDEEAWEEKRKKDKEAEEQRREVAEAESNRRRQEEEEAERAQEESQRFRIMIERFAEQAREREEERKRKEAESEKKSREQLRSAAGKRELLVSPLKEDSAR